jgi:hypothetical protein
MNEPKPFASLTAGLLARKGSAKPAMRPSFGHAPAPTDDLGWNDMGHASSQLERPRRPLVSQPAPAVQAPEPNIVAQQHAKIAETFSAPIDKPAPVKKAETAAVIAPRKHRTAFTLRLDHERHLKLRLACAVTGRSAQQLVMEAVEQLLASLPEISTLAEQVPPGLAKRN